MNARKNKGLFIAHLVSLVHHNNLPGQLNTDAFISYMEGSSGEGRYQVVYILYISRQGERNWKGLSSTVLCLAQATLDIIHQMQKDEKRFESADGRETGEGGGVR